MRIRKLFIMIFILILCIFPCSLFSQEIKESNKERSAPKETSIKRSKPINSISEKERNGKAAGTKIKNQSAKNEDTIFLKWLKILNEYSSFFSAVTALFAALIALYLGDWKSRMEKPRLKINFEETKTYPFFQTIAYENFGYQLDINGVLAEILRPGFNARVMIENKGKRTAKRVEAKIEKIQFFNEKEEISSSRHYHPTTIKWSGEKDWSPVDIVPNSHFFLDLFWAKNETSSEIISFNESRYRINGIELDNELLKDIVTNEIQPTQEIYWNVWVDNSYDRGLPRKYNVQGEIHIYIVVNADNCSPVTFKAIVDWTYDSWNKPNIRIQC